MIRPSRRWFALPVAALVAVGALAPLALIVIVSFWRAADFALIADFSLDAWRRLFASRELMGLIGKALALGGLVALLTPPIAYPVALAIARLPVAAKGTAVIVVLTPLYCGEIVRIYAWRLMLGGEGLINFALQGLGLVDEPVRMLLFTPLSAVIVMIYNGFPFMVIAIWAAAEGLDRRLIEAARDLGAPPLAVFATVTLPLTARGLSAGMAVVFALAAGDALTPALMAGTAGTTAMSMIETLFGAVFDWPLAAALTLALLAALTLGVAVFAAPLALAARRRG